MFIKDFFILCFHYNIFFYKNQVKKIKKNLFFFEKKLTFYFFCVILTVDKYINFKKGGYILYIYYIINISI